MLFKLHSKTIHQDKDIILLLVFNFITTVIHIHFLKYLGFWVILLYVLIF